MAKRRVKPRGRTVALCILSCFVLVAMGVIYRRSEGMSGARELDSLQERRLQLEGQRAALQGDIRAASSRVRLAPIAERKLGMHIATDSQYIILPLAAVAP